MVAKPQIGPQMPQRERPAGGFRPFRCCHHASTSRYSPIVLNAPAGLVPQTWVRTVVPSTQTGPGGVSTSSGRSRVSVLVGRSGRGGLRIVWHQTISFKLSRMGEGSKPLFSAPGPKFILRGQIRWSLVEASNHDFDLIIGYRKCTTSACGAVASACVSVCKTRFLFECSARPDRKCGERSTTRLAAICAMANAHPDRIAFNPKLDAATNATAGSKWHDDTVVHDRPPFHVNERFACMFHLQCHRAVPA